jgi:hypothetical protein
MHALKRPEIAYPMHVLNVKFMQLPSSSLNGPTGPVLWLFCSRDNTRSKEGQIENFIRILRCFEAEPVLPEGKYRSSSKVHYVLQLFSQLWHHCLSMFSASHLEGFGGRKSDHVIFGLVCLWLLRYTNSRMGPPNPKRRLGRSLENLRFLRLTILQKNSVQIALPTI